MNGKMKKIYISGPITDLKTGQPREGWQKDFLEAEARLRQMGFYAINPVDIARKVDSMSCRNTGTPSPVLTPEPPSRADYIMACLQYMMLYHKHDLLDGVYVIGDNISCYSSRGVQMELSLAEVLGVPVYAECMDCRRVDHNIVSWPDAGTIEELLEE